MYETKIQIKIQAAQKIIDDFLQILRLNDTSDGVKICQEKELVNYYKKMSTIIKSMERIDPPWEFRIVHPGIILALTNYRSAIMELINYCNDKNKKHLEFMLNLIEQGYHLMEENEEHILKINPKDGKIREAKFKNSCFIATAIYGDINALEVVTLRNFRNDYLLERWWGRIFVHIYYKFSPFMAKYLEKNSKLSNYTKKILNNFLKYVNRQNKY
jgi:hypothetical protein